MDDGSEVPCSSPVRRHYAFRRDVTLVYGPRWAEFLQMVTEQRSHLCSATRMLDVSSEKDLRDEDRLFMKKLRQYHDVLFVEEGDSFGIYQERLRKMHNLGILNLSFAPIDEKDELQQAMAEKRSLVCRLREANKKLSN